MSARSWKFLSAVFASVAILVSALSIPAISGAAVGPTGNGPMLFQSGTYVPTFDSTNSANITSATFSDTLWSRVGDVVTVSGQVLVDPVAGSNTLSSVYFSLPSDAPYNPASANSTDAIGVATGETFTTAAQTGARILMSTTAEKPYMAFYSGTTDAKYFRFTFQYLVR